MSIIIILLFLLVIFLLSFGKKSEEIIKKKFQISPGIKWLVIMLWLLLAVVTGAVYADPLYNYLIFGLWFFLFLLGLMLVVGLIDMIIKTSYFKIPGFLIIFVVVCYIIVFFLKER